MYNSILLKCVMVNYRDMVVNIDIAENKTYQWTDCSLDIKQ